MRTLPLIYGQARTSRQTDRFADISFNPEAQQDNKCALVPFPIDSKVRWGLTQSHYRVGEFFKGLSTAALRDFDLIAEILSIRGSTFLFHEGHELHRVLFLLAGKAKLSVNSIDGGRLILGIAGPGDILGLKSAILGSSHDMTAEANFPCIISSVQRKDFLEFLTKHPVSIQNVARELSMDSNRIYRQLRNPGFNLVGRGCSVAPKPTSGRIVGDTSPT
jgi:CRP-like cAMP-binding protein